MFPVFVLYVSSFVPRCFLYASYSFLTLFETVSYLCLLCFPYLSYNVLYVSHMYFIIFLFVFYICPICSPYVSYMLLHCFPTCFLYFSLLFPICFLFFIWVPRCPCRSGYHAEDLGTRLSVPQGSPEPRHEGSWVHCGGRLDPM